MSSLNAYQKLRQQVSQTSTRTYAARGILAVRCEACQLKASHCICAHKKAGISCADFVLILHRDELFKPTNSGRLIADCFPEHTHAFCWSRLEPDPALLALLNDPDRQCFIVFPAEATPSRQIHTQVQPTARRRTTFIMLDGTWKQARRMFNLSPWLAGIPALSINPSTRAAYVSREAAFDHYLSTAESAALALDAAGDCEASQRLFDWFTVFNQHYGAMRANMTVEQWQATQVINRPPEID